jgi:eukaryotic-like serine/threonine-protein kinase
MSPGLVAHSNSPTRRAHSEPDATIQLATRRMLPYYCLLVTLTRHARLPARRFSLPADLLERVQSSIGPNYTIHRQLGVGGTAVVYLGEDLKHERSVALKVLRPQIAATIGAERFLREIRFAARLTHPHILPLLDSGEVDGLPYYVMPYVDGESLAERLSREGRLAVADALALVREVADALEYAHAAGIVHRDIKPENILLLGSHGIIADFGIARAMHSAAEDSEYTMTGIAVGTPAYMSPEQAAGESTVDGRSDLYALASVLFETLIGAPPFTGPNTQVVIARRFTDIPKRLRVLRPDVPALVDEAVARALSLDPAHRHGTAGEFRRALVAAPPPVKTLNSGGLPSVAPRERRRTLSDEHVASLPSIAVIPFANLTGDPENDYLCDGITEEIIGVLSKLRNLRVAARTSSFAFKGARQDARTIGDQLKVRTILEGSVRRAGNRVRINTQLIEVAGGYQRWSERFDQELDDVFRIQDDIATAICDTLKVTLLGESPRTAVSEPTKNPHAYEAYLKGRFFLNKRTEEDLRRAVGLLTQAAEHDPEFALAQAGLADTFTVLGIYGTMAPAEVMPQARKAAERALEIDPTLAAAYVSLGVVRSVFDWDWAGANDVFGRAIAISPRYPTAHQWYAMNFLVPQGHFAEALDAIDSARTLDPLSLAIGASGGVVRYFAGDYSGSIALQRRVLEIAPDFAISHYFLATALRDMGDSSGAIESFDAAIRLSGGTPEMLAGLAQAHAKRGEADAALRLLETLTAKRSERYVSPSLLAQVHLSLGNQAVALDFLDRAAEVRDPDLVFLGLRPVYARLHGEPRFEAIRERIGLPRVNE